MDLQEVLSAPPPHPGDPHNLQYSSFNFGFSCPMWQDCWDFLRECDGEIKMLPAVISTYSMLMILTPSDSGNLYAFKKYWVLQRDLVTWITPIDR